MTKSHISAANALEQIDVLKGQLVNESKIRLKCERPISSKDTDTTPHKMRTQRKIDVHEKANIEQKAPIEAYDERNAPTEVYSEQKASIEAYGEQKAPT